MNDQLYSRASDAWSFGVILFEMWAREPPFEGLNNLKVASRVMNGGCLTPPANMPDFLASACRSLWSHASRDRPRVKDVVAAMRARWLESGELRSDAEAVAAAASSVAFVPASSVDPHYFDEDSYVLPLSGGAYDVPAGGVGDGVGSATAASEREHEYVAPKAQTVQVADERKRGRKYDAPPAK